MQWTGFLFLADVLGDHEFVSDVVLFQLQSCHVPFCRKLEKFEYKFYFAMNCQLWNYEWLKEQFPNCKWIREVGLFFTEMKATGKVACNRSSPSEQLNKSTAHMAQKFEWCFSNCKGVLTLWKTILSSEILCSTDTDRRISIGPIRIRGYVKFLQKLKAQRCIGVSDTDTWICIGYVIWGHVEVSGL